MRWPQAPFGKGLLRRRLRLAAQRFAEHGWAVMPGGYFNGRRMACDRTNCFATSSHPLYDDWETRASVRSEQFDQWWSERPHALLLPTGYAFDVLEVPALLGSRAVCGPPTGPGRATSAGRVRGPVAVTAAGSWMFLMRSGGTLAPELDHRVDVVRHSIGSWIPAPPTVLPDGPIRWKVSPQSIGWQLPDPDEFQSALVQALVALDASFLDLPVTARRRLAPKALPRPAALKPTPTLRRAV